MDLVLIHIFIKNCRQWFDGRLGRRRSISSTGLLYPLGELLEGKLDVGLNKSWQGVLCRDLLEAEDSESDLEDPIVSSMVAAFR